MGEEKTFENKVKKWLRDNGMWYVKIWGGGFQRAGIPDILACAGGTFVALELKSARGSLSELQKYNLVKITEAGGYAVAVKPENWEDVKYHLLSFKSKND